MENHTAHAGQLNVAGLQGAPSAIFKTLGSLVDFIENLQIFHKPPLIPMSVRAQNGRSGAFVSLRTIQASGQEEPGKGFHIDLLDRVVSLIELSVDNSVEWGARGHRPKSVGH